MQFLHLDVKMETLGKHALLLCTSTARITSGLQNKYNPDLSENRAIWKSNNQGFKEATFIQTGRRGGDVEMGREVVERAVPHSCVVDKNQEGYLRSERSQPQARPHSPGFQHQKDKSL